MAEQSRSRRCDVVDDTRRYGYVGGSRMAYWSRSDCSNIVYFDLGGGRSRKAGLRRPAFGGFRMLKL